MVSVPAVFGLAGGGALVVATAIVAARPLRTGPHLTVSASRPRSHKQEVLP